MARFAMMEGGPEITEKPAQQLFVQTPHYTGYRKVDMFIGPAMVDGKPDLHAPFAQVEFRKTASGKTGVEFNANTEYDASEQTQDIRTRILNPSIATYLNKPISQLRFGDSVPIGAEDYTVISANFTKTGGIIKLGLEAAKFHMKGGDFIQTSDGLQIRLSKATMAGNAEFEIYDKQGKLLETVSGKAGETVQRNDGTPLFYFGNVNGDEFCLRFCSLDIMFFEKELTIKHGDCIAEPREGDWYRKWEARLGVKNSTDYNFDPNGNSLIFLYHGDSMIGENQKKGSKFALAEFAGNGYLENMGLVNNEKIYAHLELVGPKQFTYEDGFSFTISNALRLTVDKPGNLWSFRDSALGGPIDPTTEVYFDAFLNPNGKPQAFYRSTEDGKLYEGTAAYIDNGKPGTGMNIWPIGDVNNWDGKHAIGMDCDLRANRSGALKPRSYVGILRFPAQEHPGDPNFTVNGLPTIVNASELNPPLHPENYENKFINERGDVFKITATKVEMELSRDVAKMQYAINGMTQSPHNTDASNYRHIKNELEPKLLENYPNPMKDFTRIVFDNPYKSASITIKVYDMAGREVAEVANNWEHGRGLHEIAFVKPDLPAGAYVVKMWSHVPDTESGDGANQMTFMDAKTIIKTR